MRKHPWLVGATLAAAMACAEGRDPSGAPPGGSAAGGTGGGDTTPMPRNPVVTENALPGDAEWASGDAAPPGELEGYAGQVSALPGDTIGLHLSSSPPQEVGWQLFRFGWYGGDGARAVARGAIGVVDTAPPCPVTPGTGLVRCAWPVSASIALPADALSGLYGIRLDRADGRHAWIPLVVRDTRGAPLLMQASVTTWQAYNDWGGTSLYKDHTGTTALGRAVAVSFDRPFAEDDGAGQIFRWEIHFARFLERYGYDVAYTTNLDVDDAELAGRRAFLSVGHDEYWSLGERQALEAARDAGTALLFFSANTCYWKIRLEDADAAGTPRTVVSYKGDGRRDAVQGAEQTGGWRLPPIDRPENALIGVMYESWMRFSQPLVVADGSHWVYEGTGLRTGDALPNVVGYEYDRVFPGGPDGLEVIARSPVIDVGGIPGVAEAAVHRAPSGALVFATGTIDWSLALAPGPLFDPRMERITANVLARAASVPVPTGVGSDAPPAPPEVVDELSRAIDRLAEGLPPGSGVASLPDGSFAVADPRGNRVLHVAGGRWSVLAGDGTAGAVADVAGAAARFRSPTAVAADREGNVVVADTGNHCLRRILANAQHTVVPLAGLCESPGMQDGAPGEARFLTPMGLSFDRASGDLFVADAGNGRIRALQAGTWAVRTAAGGAANPADGPATATAFSFPTAVAADGRGAVYVVDTGYQSVRVLRTDGTVVTLVRGGVPGLRDGDGTAALLGAQGGAAWIGDALYVADPGHRSIRRIVPGATAETTRVSTFASGLVLPLGLAAGQDGSLLAVDAGSGAVLRLRP